jgi:hypothetical protein
MKLNDCSNTIAIKNVIANPNPIVKMDYLKLGLKLRMHIDILNNFDEYF